MDANLGAANILGVMLLSAPYLPVTQVNSAWPSLCG